MTQAAYGQLPVDDRSVPPKVSSGCPGRTAANVSARLGQTSPPKTGEGRGELQHGGQDTTLL